MLIERLSKCAALFIAAFVLFDVSPAYAGFQWVAPSPEPAAAPAPQISTAPAPQTPSAPASQVIDLSSSAQQADQQAAAPATKNPEVITPIIIDGNSASTSSMQGSATTQMPALPQTAPVAGNEVPAAPPVLTPVTAPAPAAASAPASDVVQGFANQVPLTVALREILPPGYGFSIDQDVDMGVLVSFQGGKSWRETLSAALEPVGLVMHEQGQMISIGRIPAQTPSAPASVPMAAAAPLPSPAPTPLPAMAAPAPAPAIAAPVTAPVIITSNASAMPSMSSNPPAPSVTLMMTPSSPVKEPSAAVVPVSMVQVWNAERGDSLRKVLQDWSRRVHAEVEWLAEYDYPLQASINYSGTYEEAVRNLLMGFEGAHPEPVAQLHINPELGQVVLVIRTRGNTSRD